MSKPCSFFLAGYCKYGAACRFSHSMQPSQTSAHSRGGMQGPRRSQSLGSNDRHANSSTSKGGHPAKSSGRGQRNHQHRRARSLTHKPPAYMTRTWWTAPSPSASGPRFRVMSYNVLADELAQSHRRELYRSVSCDVLSWSTRWELIRQEITHLQPDIICLQEVDHWCEVQGDLLQLGYDGCYVQRSGGRSDGCATFWHPRSFELVVRDSVNFCDFDMRDNVGLLTLLLHKQQQQQQQISGSSSSGEQPQQPYLAVANTHILFNPKRGDMKVGQLRLLIKHLQQLVMAATTPPTAAAAGVDLSAAAAGSSPDVCCLITGDMNHQPHSPVYQFMHQGWLDCLKHDRKQMAGTTIERNMLRKFQRSRSLNSNISGSSSYQHSHQQQQQQLSRWQPQQQQQQRVLRHCASAPAVITLRQLKLAGWELEELVTATGGVDGLHLRHFVDQEQQQAREAKQQRRQQKRMLKQQQQQQQQQDIVVQADMYSAAADLLVGVESPDEDAAGPQQQRRQHRQQDAALMEVDDHRPQQQQSASEADHLMAAAAAGASVSIRTSKSAKTDRLGAVAAVAAEAEASRLYVADCDDAPQAKKARSVSNSPVAKRDSSRSSAQDSKSDDNPSLHSNAYLASRMQQMQQQAEGRLQQQQQQVLEQQEPQRQGQGTHLLPPVLKSANSKGWGRELWDEPLPAEFGDGVARHDLLLRSCYAEVLGTEPEYTSCHDSFYGTVDYIWYTPVAGRCQLNPVAVLMPPAVEDHVLPAACLPSATVPSDHICLVCDFTFKSEV